MSEVSREALDNGLAMVRELSEEIGPRPPCSDEEGAAGDAIAKALAGLGLEPEREWFASARSFGPTYVAILGSAAVAAALRRRRPTLAGGIGVLSAVLGVVESRFSRRSPLRILRRSRSSNVYATIEPSGEEKRTVCLVSHMDSSRSGLMFHPPFTPYLGAVVDGVGIAVAVNALAPLLSRWRAGRAILAPARLLIAVSLVLLVERELRGVDVPGANDNASGVGACLGLAGHFCDEPLSGTRLAILVTGSEEAGVFGMRDFLEHHATDDWVFVNFDGVGAEAGLKYLISEGGPLSGIGADAGLIEVAEKVGRRFPELAAAPLAGGSGLPYDSTPVHVSGGRAMTLANQDGAIPNYHWPSDRFSEISADAFATAVRFAARLVERLDEDQGST